MEAGTLPRLRRLERSEARPGRPKQGAPRSTLRHVCRRRRKDQPGRPGNRSGGQTYEAVGKVRGRRPQHARRAAKECGKGANSQAGSKKEVTKPKQSLIVRVDARQTIPFTLSE